MQQIRRVSRLRDCLFAGILLVVILSPVDCLSVHSEESSVMTGVHSEEEGEGSNGGAVLSNIQDPQDRDKEESTEDYDQLPDHAFKTEELSPEEITQVQNLLDELVAISEMNSTANSSWPCRRPLKYSFALRLQEWNEYVDKVLSTRDINIDEALSAMYASLTKMGLHMNAMMIGACDGEQDEVISFVQSSPLASAMFVEPVPDNFQDLAAKPFLPASDDTGGTVSRVKFVQAAVDSTCTERRGGEEGRGSTRNFTFIDKSFAEARPNEPHWVKRQLGSMNPQISQGLRDSHMFVGHLKHQQVTCLSPRHLAIDFINMQIPLVERMHTCHRRVGRGRMLAKELRDHISDLHVLKMDTEGLDYNIMNGFMDSVMCDQCQKGVRAAFQKFQGHNQRFHFELRPLLVIFESKHFAPGGTMEERRALVAEVGSKLNGVGYEVLRFGDDDHVAIRKHHR